MPFLRLNGRQEQVLLYLYEFRNSPERGVPPDPRVTLQGMVEGTGLSLRELENEVEVLKNKALVRSVKIGSKCYHHLTLKSQNELDKLQKSTMKIGFNNFNVNGSYEKEEVKGGNRSQ
jgi:hypothetical protein